MEDQWIGLMVNASFHHGDKDAVLQEIKRVFRDDLLEVRVVTDETMEVSGEYYCFVRCCNYGQHIEDLVLSIAVARVVPSYEDPHFFAEEDVAGFAVSIDERDAPGDFIYGDIVLVTENYLKNLYGVITEPGARKCKVFFRLYMRTFIPLISVTSLKWCGNVLGQMRVEPFCGPVKRKSLFRRNMAARAKEALKNFVHGAKIHRQKRRAHAKAGHRPIAPACRE